jgi:hypothetical protein
VSERRWLDSSMVGLDPSMVGMDPSTRKQKEAGEVETKEARRPLPVRPDPPREGCYSK